MLACNETITLVKHITENDDDVYTCVTVDGASWFSKTVITTSKDGATSVNTYEVRVLNTGISPAPGDYVVRGEISNVQKHSDLKDVEHFRVTSVGDNRRGSLPHWRLSGS